jgi:L-alanine-DL-glutamate epimerase-like enolase superfamily enzyme
VRLASVEVIPYALPFREPYVTARGTLRRREMVLLRLRSEEGFIGLGEAVPLSLRGGATMDRVVSELNGLAEHRGFGDAGLIEEPNLSPEVFDLSGPSRCATLTALLDLRGRIAAAEDGSVDTEEGRPVECNATLVAAAPAAVAEDARRWAEEGFSTFKLKLGSGDDAGQVRAVREAVGAEARIRVDSNAVWDVATARRTLAELEEFEIELAEQPVGTLEELAELSLDSAIPIAADESVTNTDEAERAVSMGACAYTGIKLCKVGGPEHAVEIADLLPAYISSALDGPVGIAAAAQVAQTLHETDRPERLDLAHGLATQRLFGATIAAVECELREGMLHLPPGPGLGVEIDEEALQAHRL